MNYRKHLQSDYWNTVKRKIKLRENFTCGIKCCGNQNNLAVHHISYMAFGFSIVGDELNYLEWLILLCETCHHTVHKNKKHPLNPKNPFRINVNKYKEFQETDTNNKKIK